VSVLGQINDAVATGTAVAGVTVSLSADSKTTTTDATGHYTFINVPSGKSYTLTAAKTGYQTFTANVTVPCNQNKEFNFLLTPVRTIEGTVWLDTNLDTTVAITEPRLLNARVDLLNEAGTIQLETALTNSSGKFVFANRARGRYRLRAIISNVSYPSPVVDATTTNKVFDFDATVDPTATPPRPAWFDHTPPSGG
jgi:uncharacterized surface anchored protein